MGLFDNVFKGSEKDKLGNEISEEQRRIEASFAAIGRIYYEKHREDAEGELLEGIRAVQAGQDRIILLNQRIAQVQREEEARRQANLAAQEAKKQAALAAKAIKQGVKQCTKCGAMLSADAMFCFQCGGKVELPAPMPGKACIKCHSILGSDALFCVNCGTRQDAPLVPEVIAAGEAAVTVEAEQPQERCCSSCNTVLSEDAVFCPECGTKN